MNNNKAMLAPLIFFELKRCCTVPRFGDGGGGGGGGRVGFGFDRSAGPQSRHMERRYQSRNGEFRYQRESHRTLDGDPDSSPPRMCQRETPETAQERRTRTGLKVSFDRSFTACRCCQIRTRTSRVFRVGGRGRCWVLVN